jgi:shikimate kinase
MKQILYMLIGPKGSGKTHIGTLVDQHTDIKFLRVEPIWLSLQPGEDGWKKVERIIDTTFMMHEKVMIESLGAGEGFRRFHASLAKKYPIKMIRVFADFDICLARVKNSNNIDHIAVFDNKVMDYNKIAATVTYDWALEIDNNGQAPDTEIIQVIHNLENAISLG